jgi:2-keto-4-pentenoate hydratase/2-oxohepta-3-ene-1,7-dioic acid hydratase in catechol pathway
MKLARCSDGSTAWWAVLDSGAGTVAPLHGPLADWAPLVCVDPEAPLPLRGETLPVSAVRLLAPVEPTARAVAAGATYAKHVAGIGLSMPERPAAFLKPLSSLIGPGDEIAYPAVTTQLDYEVELVAVVGTNTGLGVLGYTVGNDVSARDLQFGGSVTGMDMFSAKALDRTSGLGPWIVTRDEFGDGHPDLELRLTVDGDVRQHDRTASMVWGVGELLAYVDARMHLRCGDVLFTGTPAGVGHETGRYLEPGQVVEATIERIGTLRNVVGRRPASIAKEER